MNIQLLFPGSYASNCYLIEDSGQVNKETWDKLVEAYEAHAGNYVN